MSQSFPLEPEDIYATLAGNDDFMAVIGDYNFKSSTSNIKALSIVTPNQPLPGAKTTSGIECVIHDSSAVKRKAYITDDVAYEIPWKIFLIAWPPGTGTQLMTATQIILQIFPMAVANETVPINNVAGALAQVQIVIPSDRPIIA